jgi:hypothetical protein
MIYLSGLKNIYNIWILSCCLNGDVETLVFIDSINERQISLTQH